MQQTGNDLLSALDDLVSRWSPDDIQEKTPILEHRNGHVPIDVPMKNPATARLSDDFGTIGTLEHNIIGDTTRADDDASSNDHIDVSSDSSPTFPHNRVPTFQLFQNDQKDVMEQRVNRWNNHWNEPVPTFQNDVPLPVRSGEPWQNLPPSSACSHADAWRAWMGSRLNRKMASGHYADRNNAIVDVWNDALHVWHMAYGDVPPRTACGACGEVLEMWDATIPIIDGARVHAAQDCLDGYGDRCRAVAHDALVAIGLKPPPTA